jgi:1-acyl-sn-glycerol-3-phosphate acyltransferase
LKTRVSFILAISAKLIDKKRNTRMKKIAIWLLKLLGWKLDGSIPVDLKKYIIAVVPHTSNWDFPLGLIVRASLGRDIKFIGKHTLFGFPHGLLFRALGGYPVDRTKNNNLVDSVADIFNSKDSFAICLAPEGTRKRVDKLKTGFYYMAKKANVPLILIRFDYKTKVIGVSPPFYTTPDEKVDFEYIHSFYKGAIGKIPEYSFKPPIG